MKTAFESPISFSSQSIFACSPAGRLAPAASSAARNRTTMRGLVRLTVCRVPSPDSIVRLPDVREHLARPLREPPILELVVSDLVAPLQVLPEHRLDPLREAVVVEGQALLRVLVSRPRVEVDRADRREDPVHDHRLVVEHRVPVLVDLDPALQHVAVMEP